MGHPVWPEKSKPLTPLPKSNPQNPSNGSIIPKAKAQKPYSVQAHVKTPEVRNSIVYETNYRLTFRTYKNPGNNTATKIWRMCHGAYRAHPSSLTDWKEHIILCQRLLHFFLYFSTNNAYCISFFIFIDPFTCISYSYSYITIYYHLYKCFCANAKRPTHYYNIYAITLTVHGLVVFELNKQFYFKSRSKLLCPSFGYEDSCP